MMQLEGLSKYYSRVGMDGSFDDEFEGKTLDEIFPDRESNKYQDFSESVDGFDPSKLRPGDRV